ncbi:MAG TPA: aromatic ring-hydroxylating dioxygenase subunit alpha [Thermoanaerobaculia bacterium]|nr:aromatic ring-hydroxylating dioxygenase subunit alpha [Thermoanaerobaculia bacterium]
MTEASARTTATRTAGGARALDREYYVSGEIFRRERERIFLESWLYAGHVSEIAEPGAYLLFELDDESVVVLRDRKGDLQAFANVCRHRGSRLCAEASGKLGDRIRCPYHSWSYRLDGRLATAPNMDEVAGFDASEHGLIPVPMTIWQGLVFLSLAPAPPPLTDRLVELETRVEPWRLAELEVTERRVYEVDANWKLFFQNYSECYHCPTAHPLLNRLSPYRNSSSELSEGAVLGGPMRMARSGGSMTITGERCAMPIPGVEGEDLDLVYYYTLFPNLFLSLAPDYVLLHRVEALDVRRTRIVCDWLFHPNARAEGAFDPTPAVEFWDLTNRQDWELCANAQRGVASRAYRAGPYSEMESEVAAFDRQYLKALGD